MFLDFTTGLTEQRYERLPVQLQGRFAGCMGIESKPSSKYALQVIYFYIAGMVPKSKTVLRYELPAHVALIIVDGSWDVKKRMGVAMIIFDPRGYLCTFQTRRGVAEDAMVAEANAVLMALQTGRQLLTRFQGIHIYSDSQIIVHSINNRSLQELNSWQAEGVVQQCIQEATMSPEITLAHARREAVQQAHGLANAARRGTPSLSYLSQNLHRAPCYFAWV